MSRIGLIGENSIEYIDKLIDIWNNGDCAVLIDWRIPYQTAVEMMKEASVISCYIENTTYAIYNKNSSNVIGDVKFIPYEKNTSAPQLLPEYLYNKFKESYNKEEAVIIYSSGTTGKAKGIILSHFALNTNADSIVDYMKLTDEDCIYMVKTISHASSITGELLVSLKARTKLLIAPIIVPPRYVFKNIENYKATKICINPVLLEMYCKECNTKAYNLSILKEIYVHGSKAKKELCSLSREIFDGVDIYFEYGLSEAGPRVTSQKVGQCKSDSAGKPIKGVEVMIADECGNAVECGERGSIYVNTPSRFDGYVVGNKRLNSLRKGWINSGDIGYLDEDNELYVIGRTDNIIIIDSHKIYPSEVESQILKNTGISECVVINLKYNDKDFIGCVYVGQENSEQEIRDNLKKVMATYEIPRRFIQCNAIPHTLNGKISREDVRAKIICAIETE